jgi:hypothetical protein
MASNWLSVTTREIDFAAYQTGDFVVGLEVGRMAGRLANGHPATGRGPARKRRAGASQQRSARLGREILEVDKGIRNCGQRLRDASVT